MARLFTRILVPTDFSEPADAALAYAKSLAQASEASLHVLHVIEDPLSPMAGVDGMGQLPADLPETVRREAEGTLASRFGPADRERTRGTVEIRMGSLAARAIVDAANEQGADLIVMGTHGRTGLAHLVLGSVAERVVRTAHCPVLTMRRAPAVSPAVMASPTPVPAM
jgi:universal stress protein A